MHKRLINYFIETCLETARLKMTLEEGWTANANIYRERKREREREMIGV